MGAKTKCKEHIPDLMAMRFAMCKTGHVAVYQRTCTVCGKKYCMACEGQTFERARELVKATK